jgi:hypothetical protein
MQFIKKSVPGLQEEISYYANELIGSFGAAVRKAPLAIDTTTIGTKLQNLASEAGRQKIDLLTKGNRKLAKIYAQEIDALVQLAEIFYGVELEKLGSGKARKIDALCRVLIAFAVEAGKLFKEQAAEKQLMPRYSGAGAKI